MDTEDKRIARRVARLNKIKRKKRQRELLRKWGIPAVMILVVLVGIGLVVGAKGFSHLSDERQKQEETSGEKELPDDEEQTGVLEEGAQSVAAENSHEDQAETTEEAEPTSTVADEQANTTDDSQDLETISVRRMSSLLETDFSGNILACTQELWPAWISLTVDLQLPIPLPSRLANPRLVPGGFQMTDGTEGFSETILSKYGIFVDAESGNILAQKDAYERMNPASMTKILTVLVAAEHLTEADLEETAQITIDITDYSFVNDCSNTGYALDEVVTVRDLFYGTILPSGADSALALAKYVAGSHEAFVDLMNEKLVQLGLAESSHFTNCVGIYDENHYTTAHDMAVILKATVDNPFCRDVMSAHTYTTSLTEQHPEGLLVSNWFLRRIEDRDTHGEVLCAKTGFVDQSGSCAASLGLDNEGREYICVTAGSNSSWTCIADQVELYQRFLPETDVTE